MTHNSGQQSVTVIVRIMVVPSSPFSFSGKPMRPVALGFCLRNTDPKHFNAQVAHIIKPSFTLPSVVPVVCILSLHAWAQIGVTFSAN